MPRAFKSHNVAPNRRFPDRFQFPSHNPCAISPPKQGMSESKAVTNVIRDLLRRHSSLHSTDNLASNRFARRTTKACSPCSIAKVHCNDQKPYRRCRKHGLQYSTTTRSARFTRVAPQSPRSNALRTPSSTLHQSSLGKSFVPVSSELPNSADEVHVAIAPVCLPSGLHTAVDDTVRGQTNISSKPRPENRDVPLDLQKKTSPSSDDWMKANDTIQNFFTDYVGFAYPHEPLPAMDHSLWPPARMINSNAGADVMHLLNRPRRSLRP
jgi:hypothetical protein